MGQRAKQKFYSKSVTEDSSIQRGLLGFAHLMSRKSNSSPCRHLLITAYLPATHDLKGGHRGPFSQVPYWRNATIGCR